MPLAEHAVHGRIGEADVELRAGELAQLADGAVVARVGDTEVLVTATASLNLREGVDFFPLTVDVEERMYAVGRIPGSFFRREGRATEKAILACRLIDRPLRPNFKEGFRHDTHVVATVLSADLVNEYEVPALNAASAALTLSDIPFDGPIGAVRLALLDGQWVVFPTTEQLAGSVFEIVVAGKRNPSGEIDIAMVEAGATEHGYRLVVAGAQASDEATVARGLEEAKSYIAALIDLQLELRRVMGDPEPKAWAIVEDYSRELYERVDAVARPKLVAVGTIVDKRERLGAEEGAREATFAELAIPAEDADTLRAAKAAFRSVQKRVMRERVVADGVRLDGRGLGDIRPLQVKVGMVPEAHGSGLFQRGETQVLNVTTLGMLKMEQMLDTISVEESKRYMHHYNMPPFATGEAGFMRGPKRREIGHGALAEKALLPVIPSEEKFPYAFRLVSEVLMSNGSSSMASVCGSTLSLMDAGVPIEAPVAGIAMGLIAHEGAFVTLTDILGAEDALGDMDFKVAGTRDMITALQLDTKIESLPAQVLVDAMEQARQARLVILDAMAEVLPEPRPELAETAPKIEAVVIPRDRIGEVIGPKGKTIRELEEETGATIEIEDDGTVRIGSPDTASLNLAKQRIMAIGFPPEPELGKTYQGEVVNITKFGAFVNILPGRDGLLHISKIGGGKRIERVEDVLALGEKVEVVVREIDDRGKVSLDMAGAEPAEGEGEAAAPAPRSERREGDRGRDRGNGGRQREGGGNRRHRDRDRGERTERAERPQVEEKPGRTVVSFEDDFEAGL
ncbi:MAG: polyribonucleotide nucleotidyltransferase [Actinobacteria bacterium]|nr:MAG: polyribonucleotide nucleotidyltransferase [Actinomycetota bacterium]